MKNLPRLFLIIFLELCLISGCAMAPRKRFMIGAGASGIAGAAGGALLSPNSESCGINTLVFGLVGIVVGGLAGILIHDDAEVPDLKKVSNTKNDPSSDFIIDPSSKELPPFVRERLKKIIVEELQEPDSISEDGSLHEPHKVYRIKQQAELISKPLIGDRK